MLAAAASLAFAGDSGQRLTVTLDWTANPNHIGLYDAAATGLFARAGLDVTIRVPSDPTAPLKLVGAGKSDLAVSYEQEVFLAAEQHLPVVAVAALVPQPLNSFMAIEPQIRTLADLHGRSVGITGVPSDYAILKSAGLLGRVKVVAVGYNLLPALLAHRVDAVLGVYRNVEGIQLELRGLRPTIIPVDRAGVPTYDELVLVANTSRLTGAGYRSEVKRAVGAILAGMTDARAHPARAASILKKVTGYDSAFLARSTPATLALLATPHGVGCLDRPAWQRFGSWLHARGLLKQPVAAASVVTTALLPARCR